MSQPGEEARLKTSVHVWIANREYLMMIWGVREYLSGEDVLDAYQLVFEFKAIVALCISHERRLAARYPHYQVKLEELAELRRCLQTTHRDVFHGVPETDRERIASSLGSRKRPWRNTIRWSPIHSLGIYYCAFESNYGIRLAQSAP
jgi:hypothetical protein